MRWAALRSKSPLLASPGAKGLNKHGSLVRGREYLSGLGLGKCHKVGQRPATETLAATMLAARDDEAILANGRGGLVRGPVWSTMRERLRQAIDAEIGVAAWALAAPKTVAENPLAVATRGRGALRRGQKRRGGGWRRRWGRTIAILQLNASGRPRSQGALGFSVADLCVGRAVAGAVRSYQWFPGIGGLANMHDERRGGTLWPGWVAAGGEITRSPQHKCPSAHSPFATDAVGTRFFVACS